MVYFSHILLHYFIICIFKVKPTIKVMEMEPAQAYSYRKQLECVIEAYPVPTEEQITWTHNSVPINPSR